MRCIFSTSPTGGRSNIVPCLDAPPVGGMLYNLNKKIKHRKEKSLLSSEGGGVGGENLQTIAAEIFLL